MNSKVPCPLFQWQLEASTLLDGRPNFFFGFFFSCRVGPNLNYVDSGSQEMHPLVQLALCCGHALNWYSNLPRENSSSWWLKTAKEYWDGQHFAAAPQWMGPYQGNQVNECHTSRSLIFDNKKLEKLCNLCNIQIPNVCDCLLFFCLSLMLLANLVFLFLAGPFWLSVPLWVSSFFIVSPAAGHHMLSQPVIS